MTRTLTKRKCMLALILGVSVFIMLAPSTTAFFSTPTQNLPPPGWRNRWQGLEVNTDVSASVDQIDNLQANINLQAFTGGPIGNPQIIGPPPIGQDWVWVVEYDIRAELLNPPNWVIETQAAIRAELYLIRGGMNWKCTENVDVIADAQVPIKQDTGWLYLYDANAQYRQGDIYFLYVHAQGRFFDNATIPPQWNTSAQQFVELYYLI